MFSNELKVGFNLPDTRSAPGASKLTAFSRSVFPGFTDMDQVDVFSGVFVDDSTGQIADALKVLMSALQYRSVRNRDRVLWVDVSRDMARKGLYRVPAWVNPRGNVILMPNSFRTYHE